MNCWYKLFLPHTTFGFQHVIGMKRHLPQPTFDFEAAKDGRLLVTLDDTTNTKRYVRFCVRYKDTTSMTLFLYFKHELFVKKLKKIYIYAV